LRELSKHLDAKPVRNIIFQDAERQNLELEEELADLKQSNTQLFLERHERKRELINWEKRVQLAVEAREQTKESLHTSGELGGMKTDIHRMKVSIRN